MESKNSPPSTSLVKCCDHNCTSSIINRSVKRKYDEFDEEIHFNISQNENARVEIENECEALRETVKIQQWTIQNLTSELEQERNAASSAANEAMSMILKLQSEKSEILMESRQFKRFAEEKMAHEQEEALSLEELLYKREQTIHSLTCEVQAYKHRMMSYGLTEIEADGENNNIEGQFDFPIYEIYPPLRCNSRAYLDGEDEPNEKLKDLEYRINQLEKSPRNIQTNGELENVLENVIIGQSPKQGGRHIRKFSTDSLNSFPTESPSFKKTELTFIEENSNLRKIDDSSEIGDDRVYTVDLVHQGGSLEDSVNVEVQKLYARLHALEADRESMRQEILSIGTETAQMVLLKEIAQNLCKEKSPARSVAMRKKSVVGSFSFTAVFKWITSFVFWKRKAHRCRYMFGLSPHDAGLLILLDRSHRVGTWKRISTTRVKPLSSPIPETV